MLLASIIIVRLCAATATSQQTSAGSRDVIAIILLFECSILVAL